MRKIQQRVERQGKGTRYYVCFCMLRSLTILQQPAVFLKTCARITAVMVDLQHRIAKVCTSSDESKPSIGP